MIQPSPVLAKHKMKRDMNQPLELIVISKGLFLRYNALWWRRNSDSRSKKTMGER
jgi:hypothetical protein